jgi:small subunit ribosomal protein S16
MLKIKLARFGKSNQPHYRIVVIEGKSKRDGEYVENLGHYAPTETPKTLQINVESYMAWVKKGAQPTETVSSLVERYKSGNPFPERPKKLSKKAKTKQADAAKAAEEAKAAAAEAAAQPAPVAEVTPAASEETAAPTEATTESK